MPGRPTLVWVHNDCDQGVYAASTYTASTTATWVHEIHCSPVVPVAPGKRQKEEYRKLNPDRHDNALK